MGAIREVKASDPHAGSRRIRDVLKRYLGLGVSETTVRRVLQAQAQAGAARTTARAKPRPKPKRFEHAEPNQLWQSDLFTFLLRKHERLYVAAFLNALLCADAAVPYRTSFVHGPHYDGALVLRAVVLDFDLHGVPLALRMDRYRAHGVDPVRQWLAQRQVLVLHGPLHCARFYGQLERQNREHRAWLDALSPIAWERLEVHLTHMLHALNSLWPRRALHWHTPIEIWAQRPTLRVNRARMRNEVNLQTQRIARKLADRGRHDQLAERLAIIQVLERRGYLRLTRGDGCQAVIASSIAQIRWLVTTVISGLESVANGGSFTVGAAPRAIATLLGDAHEIGARMGAAGASNVPRPGGYSSLTPGARTMLKLTARVNLAGLSAFVTLAVDAAAEELSSEICNSLCSE